VAAYAGTHAATPRERRVRRRRCGRVEGEGGGGGASDDDAQSFSLACTPRIPNLGHTDTNAISVPRPSEAAAAAAAATAAAGGREGGGGRGGRAEGKRVAEFEPGWSESYESEGLWHGRCARARIPPVFESERAIMAGFSFSAELSRLHARLQSRIFAQFFARSTLARLTD